MQAENVIITLTNIQYYKKLYFNEHIDYIKVFFKDY